MRFLSAVFSGTKNLQDLKILLMLAGACRKSGN
jgi:hypothetical protein